MTPTDQTRAAIVTGASGAIGCAIAKSLAAAGFDLMLHYRRNTEATEALAASLRNGIRVRTFQADLSRSVEADALVAHTIDDLGRVDVLVNCAGMKIDAPLQKLQDEEWDAVLRTNLTAVMYTTRAALPGIYGQGAGRIVNLTSIGAQTGYAGTAAYAASKAGIIGLTKVIAAEGARRGVTCNAIAPGLIGAGMGAELPSRAFGAMVAATPAGRAGAAEEVGDLCAFLASPAAAYITGQVYSVNGGLYM
jgi:NAD(P)-dependent dehydrogenase (short-subunit alcohol dehydrogenase family)